MIESLDDETLSSSLCEDVFSLAQIQVELLHEYLLIKKIDRSDSGENLVVVSLLCIIRNLHNLQMQHRDRFLRDMETSCAAANDFMRMMECFDQLMESVNKRYPGLAQRKNKMVDAGKMALLEKESDDLVALYGNDAVFAVQRSQIFVMKTIQQSSIPSDLFSREWEDEFVYNEVALSIVKTMEDYLYDFHSYLSSAFLYGKIVGALVKAVVCLYVRSIVQKADRIRRRKRKGNRFVGGVVEAPFRSTDRAVMRMMYDMEVFRTYFQNLIKQLPGLDKLVEEELSVLVVIHESLSLILDETNNRYALDEFIVVLHVRVAKNAHVTKFLMQDLWRVAAPSTQQRVLYDTLALMDGELQLLSNKMEEGRRESPGGPRPRDRLPGLLLQEVLLEHYEHRILAARLRPCAPCINIIRKAQAKKATAAASNDQPKSPDTIASMFSLDFLSLSHEDNKPKFKLSDIPDMIPTFTMRDAQLPSIPSVSSAATYSPSTMEDEPTRADHEKTLKAVRQRLLSNLKLHNIKFVAHSTTDVEKRMEKINGWS